MKRTKLNNHQKFLAKKFKKSRQTQKAQRARLAHLRQDLKSAYNNFLNAVHEEELSTAKLLRETRRVRELNERSLKKLKIVKGG